MLFCSMICGILQANKPHIAGLASGVCRSGWLRLEQKAIVNRDFLVNRFIFCLSAFAE